MDSYQPQEKRADDPEAWDDAKTDAVDEYLENHFTLDDFKKVLRCSDMKILMKEITIVETEADPEGFGKTSFVLLDNTAIDAKDTENPGQTAKEILLQWLGSKYRSRGFKPLWENYSLTVCDDEIIDAFMRYLREEQNENSWKNVAYHFSEILLRAEDSEKIKDSFEYLRDIMMHGTTNNDRVQSVAEDAKRKLKNWEAIDNSIVNTSYLKLFINLEKYFCR